MRLVGTPTGTTIVSACKRGGCRSFNGSSDFISTPIDLSAYSKITVSFWLYKSAFANDDQIVLEYTPNFNTAAGFGFNSNSSSGFFSIFANSTLYTMSREGTSLFCEGKMDDLRIYNRILSAQEIHDLYIPGIRISGGAVLSQVKMNQ